MESEKIRRAVGAIITQNNEVLLVHKVNSMDVIELDETKQFFNRDKRGLE